MAGKITLARTVRHCATFIAVAALFAGGSTRGDAQEVAADARLNEGQHVTLDVDNMPLVDALQAITKQVSLTAVYDKGVIPAGVRVTVHARNIPVTDAFRRVLQGTGLVAQIRATGNVSIVLEKSVAVATGAVSGIVTDAATRKPVGGASVVLDDSVRTMRTQTNDRGAFSLKDIPVGTHKMTVRRIGYRVSTTIITVRADSTETVAVRLTPTANVLNQVVTTATGDQRRIEVGNAVGTINADSVVKTSLIRNMSDLLQSRVPGVVVTNTDGAVGSPSRIRLRGVNSVALNNDPIIILDGIRLNSQSTVAPLQTNVGSATMLSQEGGPRTPIPTLAPSRLDDIDPNTIESIDVLRGPSASSLYGTDAANGVIVIKTKRGRVGSWRTTVSGDIGGSSPPGKAPELWWGWGHYNYGLITTGCHLAAGGTATVQGGGCLQDSVTQFNPQNYGPMQTQGNGTSRSLTADVSGGTEQLQQYLSGHVGNTVGTAKISDAESRLIARLWGEEAPSWMVRPNTERKYDGTSRTTFVPTSATDVSVTATGLYRTVLNGGSGIQNVFVGTGASPIDTLAFLPSESQRTKSTSAVKGGKVAGTANYRPYPWLTANSVVGGDYSLRTDDASLRAQDCSTVLQAIYNGAGAACPSGHTSTRSETFVTTANVGARLTYRPVSWIDLQTAVGEQYSHTNFSSLRAGNSDASRCPLQFGTDLLTPNPICASIYDQVYNVVEARDEAATAGVYIEETVGIFGIYNTFGVRHDVASAFGGETNKKPPNYPKFNISFPLSDKGFFPKQPWVTSLRLRLAYGQSGNQASQTAVLNNFTLTQSTYRGASSSVNTVLVTQLGNPNLRPEKGTEWEGGVDVSFLQNERLHTELTLYKKFTRDAITSLTLAPSFGVDNLSTYQNLGNVENRGIELMTSARVIDARLISWDVSMNFAKNTNKLVHKSSTLSVEGPLNTQFREGYPLFGYWGAPVEAYADANGDGFLESNEVKFGTQKFMGAPYPTSSLTYSSTLSLLNSSLIVSANVSQVNGQTTALCVRDGCATAPRAAVDPKTPLAEQAAYIQAVVNNYTYLGEASSVRLNELSATYSVPPAIARRLLHMASLSVTLAGRNLALWTNYAGKDPNVDTSGLFGEATQDNALGTPQPRSFALRFNLGL